jgi:hypothetical protein
LSPPWATRVLTILFGQTHFIELPMLHDPVLTPREAGDPSVKDLRV